jgi:hypothetical protein
VFGVFHDPLAADPLHQRPGQPGPGVAAGSEADLHATNLSEILTNASPKTPANLHLKEEDCAGHFRSTVFEVDKIVRLQADNFVLLSWA